jgi:hypothetical protein
MGRFFAGLILLSGVAVAAWAQNPIDAQIEAVKRLQDERKAQELQQQAEYQHQAQLEYERRQQEAAAAQQAMQKVLGTPDTGSLSSYKRGGSAKRVHRHTSAALRAML